MSQKKTVVVAHGIGRHDKNFADLWEPYLQAIAKDARVDISVEGLWWDELQQQLDKKYGASKTAADLASQIGFPQLRELEDNAGFQQARDVYKDLLFYLCCGEMLDVLLTHCSAMLTGLFAENGKYAGQEGHTILIGHSLGAAMLPHVTWSLYGNIGGTGLNPFHSLILLASPLAMGSPCPGIVADPLAIMKRLVPDYTSATRREVLDAFSSRWGAKRLNFIINRNDLVCANATYTDDILTIPHIFANGHILPDMQKDFSDDEASAIRRENQTLQPFEFGEPRLKAILDNHAVEIYLQSQPFKDTFRRLLQEDGDTP